MVIGRSLGMKMNQIVHACGSFCSCLGMLTPTYSDPELQLMSNQMG